MTVTIFFKLNGRDLSTTRVAVGASCKAIRIKDMNALLHVVALFGVSSVIGIRKRPPRVVRLKQYGAKASSETKAYSAEFTSKPASATALYYWSAAATVSCTTATKSWAANLPFR